ADRSDVHSTCSVAPARGAAVVGVGACTSERLPVDDRSRHRPSGVNLGA
ncbi:MAG: hypothetical protein QOF53_1603, partial [Nocardioidaceae bacterium]|nr:hypothetical protein [Nocardioidaceae bacterium]